MRGRITTTTTTAAAISLRAGSYFFPPLTPHQTLQTLSFYPPAPIPGALRFRCLVCLTNHSSALPNELEAPTVNNVRCTLTGGTGQQGRITCAILLPLHRAGRTLGSADRQVTVLGIA
jgi:hypothetical protein